jgi:hypothetical protein
MVISIFLLNVASKYSPCLLNSQVSALLMFYRLQSYFYMSTDVISTYLDSIVTSICNWDEFSHLLWNIIITPPVFWPKSRDKWTVSSGTRSRLSSIQTTLIGRMASPSASHGGLSFATYGNKKPAPNKNTTHSGEPWKGPFSSLSPLPTQAPPCNLTVGSLLVRIPVTYSFPVIGSLSSALALLVLYKPSISLSLQPWKMETVRFSETWESTNISTQSQNPKIKKTR